MDQAPVITFRNVDRSESVVAVIERQCRQMEHFYPRITAMHVIVSAPGKRHRKGNRYHVTVEADLPGKTLAASHAAGLDDLRHDRLVPLIKESFRVLARQIEDYARLQRGDTKRHAREENLAFEEERMSP